MKIVVRTKKHRDRKSTRLNSSHQKISYAVFCVKDDMFDYIERFYNPKRRHSTIGYLSPMQFERHSGFFFFNDTATTEIYTLSLHDALPISRLLCPWDSPGKKTEVGCHFLL